MKKIIFALLYTVALASALAHFSGCYSVDDVLNSYAGEEKKEDSESVVENKPAVSGVTSSEVVAEGDKGNRQEQNGNIITEPTAGPTAEPAAEVTAEPTPKNETETVAYDDKAAVKKLVNSFAKKKDTRINQTDNSGSNIYFDNEKDATHSIIERCAHYSSVNFAILYKDTSSMHSVDYYMDYYPEISSMKVLEENSGVYYNGILVYYVVEMKEGAAYDYALRSGDTSILTKEEKYVISYVREISEDLRLAELSDIEKIKTVHDYIVNHSQYDYDYADISHSAYGLFRNGKAVCDGYAQAFLVFMDINGIECQIVSGVAGQPVENHAWNQVKVDGEWYNIDVTFDDPTTRDKNGNIVDTLSYDYFMIDDNENDKDHVVYSSYVKTCDSEKYTLYPYEAFIAHNEDEVRSRIEEQKRLENIRLVYAKKGDVDEQLCKKVFKEFTKKRYTYYAATEIRDGWYLFEIINPEI